MNPDLPPEQNQPNPVSKTENKEGLSLNVLFADDDPSISFIAPKLLTNMGHRVTAVKNGLELFEELKKQGGVYDLVLSDNTMPGRTGLSVLTEVKSVEGLKNIPFIIATTDDPSIRGPIEKLGGYFLKKPYVKDELSAAIRKAVEAKQ